MDASLRIASHTGRDCVDWCGHIEGNGFSIAGNMLAGARVLDDTAKTYAANEKLPFAQRLIAAMRSGRGRRRRQARQAIGRTSDPWRGGVVRSRPACRRPCRSARRA